MSESDSGAAAKLLESCHKARATLESARAENARLQARLGQLQELESAPAQPLQQIREARRRVEASRQAFQAHSQPGEWERMALQAEVAGLQEEERALRKRIEQQHPNNSLQNLDSLEKSIATLGTCYRILLRRQESLQLAAAKGKVLAEQAEIYRKQLEAPALEASLRSELAALEAELEALLQGPGI